MKIAVTYENGQIFQHFGHTEQFKIYETANKEILSSQVVSTGDSGHGALAEFLQAHGVETLICGGIGGGAKAALAKVGIRLYGGCTGEADQAVENLLNNVLMYRPDVSCDHHDHEGGDHHCGDSCGHGSCGSEEPQEEEARTITLTVTDDNGRAEDTEFRLIAIYMAGKQQYIALTPDLDAPELEADIYLFRYSEDDGQCTVEEIVEEEEFADAAAAFQNWQLNR